MKNHFKIWIILSLVVVFVAGLLSGIFLEQHLIHKRTKKKTERRSSVRFPSLKIMAEELGLTSEQQEQIRDIFKNSEERMKELSSNYRERYSQMRAQLKKEIENVLSEEQNQKFEAMIQKYISQRKKETEKRSKGRKRHSSKTKKSIQNNGDKK
jgi:Spy/CpxP family protein refolding chaperone